MEYKSPNLQTIDLELVDYSTHWPVFKISERELFDLWFEYIPEDPHRTE